jgi:hypothetical protein
MGRKVRLATTTQRRAARIRDGGCVFPGCDEPPERCRMHHINLWDHGGLTDFAVLAALCPHHHGVTHRNHWHMHATPDAWFYWQTPTGRTIWSQRHGRQHPGPPPPAHLTPNHHPPLDTRPHRAA